MTTTSTEPASPKQVVFLQRLMAERLTAEQLNEAERTLEFLNKREASQAIDELLRKPKLLTAPAAPPAADPPVGVHFIDDTVYKVVKSKSTGRPYAKRLIVPTPPSDKWAYEGRRPFAQMSEATLMTLEQGKEFGAFHGVCVVCAANLSAELSVELGIGPVCGKRLHDQHKAAAKAARRAAAVKDELDLDAAVFLAERYGQPIPGAGTPEQDPRDVEWWNPASPDFEREYADEADDAA